MSSTAIRGTGTATGTGTGHQERRRQQHLGVGGFVGRHLRATFQGPALAGLAVLNILAFSAVLVAVALLGIGLGVFLVPPACRALHRTADLTRRVSGRWSHVAIEEPYLPPAARGTGVKGWAQRTRWALSDQGTWRDMVWALVSCVVGAVLALVPLTIAAYGLMGLLMPFLWEPISDAGGNNWYLTVHVTDSGSALTSAALGLPVLLAGLAAAPHFTHAHARLARTLLAPTEMARQVRHLTRTRSDAVETSAAELRRIERDLHDGAQARLVAMGMNLGVAERLLSKDPEAARAILVDARDASASALNELRDLVRGIHPPVLAERGLADGVRALGLDSPLHVEVDTELDVRFEAPVETAMYFAICEALTNAAKHGGARRVTVELWHTGGRLRAQVTDDGHGGADPAHGTGLRGVERRLATFDGTLAVNSPVGGPTTLTMELPCAPSSPKTPPTSSPKTPAC